MQTTDPTTRHEILRRALRGLVGAGVVLLHLVTAAALASAQDREAAEPDSADEATREDLPSTPYQAVFDLGTTQLEAPAAALLPDGLQLEASSAEPTFTLVGLQPRVPQATTTGDDVGRLVLTWRRTVNGVTHWLDLRDEFGQKTASPPVFGRTDLLNISGSEVWVNVVDSEQRSPLHFGPYLQGWKSFRSTFDGHYGVQLRMSW